MASHARNANSEVDPHAVSRAGLSVTRCAMHPGDFRVVTGSGWNFLPHHSTVDSAMFFQHVCRGVPALGSSLCLGRLKVWSMAIADPMMLTSRSCGANPILRR